MTTSAGAEIEVLSGTRDSSAGPNTATGRGEQLRAQIAAGTYSVSAEAVAERLMERMLRAHRGCGTQGMPAGRASFDESDLSCRSVT